MDTPTITPRAKSRFDRDGYLVIHQFFSRQQAADLQARFARIIAQDVPTYPATDAFYEHKGQPDTLKYLARLKDHDPYFAELLLGGPFVDVARQVLGDEPVPQGIEWFNKCSRIGPPTPPHQDGFYYMLEPNEGVHFWLALDHVDEENGCIRYVKGSHRGGLRPHARSQVLGFSQAMTDFGPGDEALEEAMVMQPGDLLVHHTLTIHRAGPNTSNRERRAMGLIYFAARAKVDWKRRDEYRGRLFADLSSQGKI